MSLEFSAEATKKIQALCERYPTKKPVVMAALHLAQKEHGHLSDDALQLVARTSDAYIYENPNALPRVLFVNDWMQADTEALVATGAWPQFDPLRTVLLESAPEIDESMVELASNPASHPGVRIRHYENTRVVVEVDAAHAGFLVLHDVWHPWWTADIDGHEALIHRANVLFRAVQVPAGHHLVTFEFRPISGALADVGDRLLEPRDQ